MIITIPYFPGYTDYDRLAVAIGKQGRQDGHCVLVVSRRSDEESAMGFEDKVKDSFSHHVHRVVDSPVSPGAFATSNEMFRQALRYMDRHEPGKGEVPGMPMLYFEPVFGPAKPQWVNEIQSEYFARGMPQVLTCFKTAGSLRTPWGSAVFSREYPKNSALLPHLPSGIHWREYLRHEIGQCSAVSLSLFPGARRILQKLPRKAVKA